MEFVIKAVVVVALYELGKDIYRFVRNRYKVPFVPTTGEAYTKLAKIQDHLEAGREKLDSLASVVETEIAPETQKLRDDVHELHAKLDAEVIHLETTHSLLS